MVKRMRVPRGLQRAMAATAGMAVLVAGVVVINRDTPGEAGLSALPGATGQPAPTGPTGGGSGGSGNGPAFPMQPPDMPSGPPNGYNSGSYPEPDQGNGISIYNSGAPQSPSGQGGSQQAPNYPQQLQPANGTQPPDYDAPLQTPQPQISQQMPSQPAQSPATQPTSPQQSPSGQRETEPQTPPSEQQQPDNQQQTNEHRCNGPGGVAPSSFTAHGSPIRLQLTAIGFKQDPAPVGGCCDQQKAKQDRTDKRDPCTHEYVVSVTDFPATPGAEGGLESIHVVPTLYARAMGLASPLQLLAIDKPEDLTSFPGNLVAGASDASKMWNEATCVALQTDLADLDHSQQLFNKFMKDDSVFQQFLCHFFGAGKKFWDWEGGIGKESWNFEPARPAIGTADCALKKCNP